MKKTILAACMITLGLMLGGCASGSGNVGATSVPVTPRPTATASSMPSESPEATMSASPMMSPETTEDTTSQSASAAMTPAQAGRLAEQISEAVERLSEVDDAEVILDDRRVLIAVEFDDQYSAGLDDRMKDMITERVREVDEGLTDVRITDDDTLYGQVKGLGERMAKATGLDELADDFGDLWDRLTDM